MQLSSQPILEDFLSTLEAVNLRSLDIFIDFFSVDVSFQDPFHRIHGHDQLRKLFLSRVENYAGVKYKAIDFAWGRREGLVYIACEIMKDKKFVAECMMELCMVSGGKILSCKEFWGSNHPLDQKSYSKAI
ncbi:MAG: nuclear transport factor 2 family protein [Alphaproteobacteria bacterium]|nr:nuclear transport factor 2 family protein [Alphaproteobacteria bacterium]